MKYKIYAGYYEIYVTETELDKPYVLQLETDSIDEVREYLDDIDDAVLTEESIADEIGNYNFMIRIKNGKVELVEEEDARYIRNLSSL